MRLKKVVLFVLLVLVVVVAGYNYIYQKHRSVTKEKPAFELLSEQIIEEFSAGSNEAILKYLDKVILVEGKITVVDSTSITLDDKILGYLSSQYAVKKSIGDIVKLKGRCIGYDELLEVVKLDQCTLIE